ncbi:SDR family oxidoreductase [Burkholderia glumae]|nr:SDR family oxidoreductase [Burkholderia glumae]QGA37799.1 SDR family oxidoreductase [Burkholderia glumae]
MRADSAAPQQVAVLYAAISREFGRIDVLVNNAAIIARQSRLEDLGFERMQRVFAVNAIGPCSARSRRTGRGRQPEEVARAILWLASAKASFVTGTFLDATGESEGWGCKRHKSRPDLTVTRSDAA